MMIKTDPLLSVDMQSKPDPKAELHEVAEQFEAIFLNQMLKQMRASKLADGLFDSQANETYTSLLDTEQSQQLAGNINLGIAEALVRQLGGHTELE